MRSHDETDLFWNWLLPESLFNTTAFWATIKTKNNLVEEKIWNKTNNTSNDVPKSTTSMPWWVWGSKDVVIPLHQKSIEEKIIVEKRGEKHWWSTSHV